MSKTVCIYNYIYIYYIQKKCIKLIKHTRYVSLHMLGIELSLQLAQLIFAKFVVSSRAMLLFLVFQRRFQPRAAMQTCGGG